MCCSQHVLGSLFKCVAVMAVKASLGRSPFSRLGRRLHPAPLDTQRQDSKAKVVWWLLEDLHEVMNSCAA